MELQRSSRNAAQVAQEEVVREIRVDVTHATRRVTLVFPAVTATVGDLKKELERCSGVPLEKQRLLFGGSVLKRHRRERRDEVKLLDLIARPHETKGNNGTVEHSDDADVASLSSRTVTIPLMLIGSTASVPHINEEAVAQLHRLVTTTVEHGSNWFRCSYGKGYVRQTAFVCRTCINSGRADAAHAICYACAEVCHSDHDVEEWGVRYFMRCDCCTTACWRDVDESWREDREEKEEVEVEAQQQQEPKRCCFIIDSQTGLPPLTSVVPLNSRNRYPRTLRTWCYCDCENNCPDDDPESGGIVCMLCATCYWSSHLTRLKTDMFRYLPCYGDVVEGDIVAFRCRTCDTLVCTPCRLLCHKDHDVDTECIIPSREHGTDNGASDGVEFSCGCRGCCPIAVEVDKISSPQLMSPTVATEVMNNDAFVGIICARCMQEYPWLAENNPKKCYNGQLPERVPEAEHKPIVACGLSPEAECSGDVYPFHAMLFPANAFTQEMTCPCKPCRQAYERFAPRASAAAINEMAIQLHDTCDHCGHVIKDEQAFMCQTCELQHDQTFFVCQQCNRLRLVSQLPGLCDSETSIDNNDGNGNDGGEDNSMGDAGATDGVVATSPSSVAPWDHPLTHLFLEDTYENLYALCGMQLMNGFDNASERGLVMENIDAASASLESVLRHAFGQTPLSFDPGDVAKHHQQLLLQSGGAKGNESESMVVSNNKRQHGGADSSNNADKDGESAKRNRRE